MGRARLGKMHVTMVRVKECNVIQPGNERAHFVDTARRADILALDSHAGPAYGNTAAGRVPQTRADAGGYHGNIHLVRSATSSTKLEDRKSTRLNSSH